MVNYQNGKIYKLVCNTTGLVYFGSTCEPTLARRLHGHKKDYSRGMIITSAKIIENDNYGIFLVESYPCNSKDELNMRERFYIENFECVNKCIPIRFKEEIPLLDKSRYERNKTEKLEKMKAYYVEHKQEINDYNKNYREANKEKLRENQKQYSKKEEVKIRMREACKRYRDKKRVNEFFLNFLQCFNL
jgi:hypothetical protein